MKKWLKVFLVILIAAGILIETVFARYRYRDLEQMRGENKNEKVEKVEELLLRES